MYTQAELDALGNKEYRDAYVSSQVKAFIAHQLRCIREARGLTQEAFAGLVGKPQSVVSRLEDTEYGRVTVQTLLDLAHALDVSLVVKLASFPEFLKIYGDLSPDALAVSDFSLRKQRHPSFVQQTRGMLIRAGSDVSRPPIPI